MAITQYSVSTEPVDPKNQNVIDRYKGMIVEDIRGDLDQPGRRSKLVQIALNVSGDFNKATLIRTNNAFLGHSTYMVGKRKWDRRGAVGMHHYERVYHADTLREVTDMLHADGYTVYAIDNVPEFNPQPLSTVALPEKTAFVYGEEGTGIPEECFQTDIFDGALVIPMLGAVRSLNVATAGAVATYEYNRQHGRI